LPTTVSPSPSRAEMLISKHVLKQVFFIASLSRAD
jgi:hypothetical protein